MAFVTVEEVASPTRGKCIASGPGWGCDRGIQVIAHDLCSAHNNQIHRKGYMQPLGKGPFPEEAKVTVSRKTRKDRPRGMSRDETFQWFRNQATFLESGCWESHLAPSNEYGHTQVMFEGRNVKLHRLSFEVAYGLLSGSEQVHHRCANPRCFNPEHLQAVSHKENTAEMLERRYYRDRISELEAEVAVLKVQLKEVKHGPCNC